MAEATQWRGVQGVGSRFAGKRVLIVLGRDVSVIGRKSGDKRG